MDANMHMMTVGEPVNEFFTKEASQEHDEEFDYFMVDKDSGVLKNLNQMGDHLKKLHARMLETAAIAEQAKKEYERYANNILPHAMLSAGVNSLELVDGGTIAVQRNYYCQPNKNQESQQEIREWLLKYNGGHLIKDSATIEGDELITELDAAGIPYAKNSSVNTSSLKAFIKSLLGVTSGTAQITLEDIPKCMHFQEVLSVDLNMNLK